MRHGPTPRCLGATCAVATFAYAVATAPVACGNGGGLLGSSPVVNDAARGRDATTDDATDPAASDDAAGVDGAGGSDDGARGSDADTGVRADADASATDAAPGVHYGANIHNGGGDATANQQIAALLQARNLRVVRMDLGTGQNMAPWRDQVQKLNAVGIRAETTLFTTYQYDKSCNLDLAATQSDAYAQTTTLVTSVKDLVSDFELMNEVPLRSELQAEVPTNNQAPASAYEGQPCYAVKLAVLEGMYQAIRDVAKQSGAALRIIAGTVGRDWGYLDFLKQNGIDFDLVGYHIYPSLNQSDWESDTWYGTGGLFTQLARYDRPVHLNEFNCGEINKASFENDAGGPLTEECFETIPKFLFEILDQKTVNVESVHFYEMFDEPAKAPPEDHFGLWYDVATPKVSALLASAFAGGALSPSEEAAITGRGLLTTAQIAQFK